MGECVDKPQGITRLIIRLDCVSSYIIWPYLSMDIYGHGDDEYINTIHRLERKKLLYFIVGDLTTF